MFDIASGRTCMSCSRSRTHRLTRCCGWLLAVLPVLAQQSGQVLPIYSDVTQASGVDFLNDSSSTSQKYLLESMVGGVAAFDYNADGLLDLYFVNGAAISDPMAAGQLPDKSGSQYWNRLYRNDGDWKFTDVTEQAGVRGDHFGQGVAAGDYDNDGRADLFLANFGRNILYRNLGDGSFEDVTERAGV
ncbi:MAG: VCBS repeat-containing protein, partial [Acidobacteriia bacterium]|nr:VCBS repeat-containing protein [Terriglobia bacterium]